jgi:hypothetical protein
MIRLIGVIAKVVIKKNLPAKGLHGVGVYQSSRLEIANFLRTLSHVGIFNLAL